MRHGARRRNVARPQNSVISVISLQALDFSGDAIFLKGQTVAPISCRDWTSACRYFFRIILRVIAIKRTLRFFRPMARIGMWPHGGPRSNAPIARYHRMQAEGSPQAIFFTCRLARSHQLPRSFAAAHEDGTNVAKIARSARAIFERPVQSSTRSGTGCTGLRASARAAGSTGAQEEPGSLHDLGTRQPRSLA